MQSRIGVVSILIQGREVAQQVNELLSTFGSLIVGRLGVPYRERGIHVIAIIVDGTTDDIGALTGQLGKLPSVTTKSSLLTK